MADRVADAPCCPVCGARLTQRAALRGIDRLLGVPGEFEVLICGDCGAGSTTPPVGDLDLAGLYPQGYGSHEANLDRGARASFVGALKRMQVALILRGEPFAGAVGGTAGRALDVGCARGDLAAALIERGWEVDGIEPAESASAAAGARGVTIVGTTVARASLESQTYDLVVMRHSLEHVPDPVGDLRRLAAALRPGGRLVISLPNFASWQRRVFGSRWFHLDLPRHRVHFTPASLRLALISAGLSARTERASTSVLGLPATLQYLAVGRCVAPGGTRLRVLAAFCCAVFPLTWLVDRLGRRRDTLHAVAIRA